MKRRVETTILFDFTRVVGGYGPYKGVPTTLPLPPGWDGQNAIYVRSVAVKSEEGGQKGSMRLVFDASVAHDTRAYARETVARLYENRWRNGDLDYFSGLTWYRDGFESTFTVQGGEPFCESAIWRTVAILRDLGVTKEMFVYPKVSQSTFVWVSKNKATMRRFGNCGFEAIEGWVEYGVYLASKFELGRLDSLPTR